MNGVKKMIITVEQLNRNIHTEIKLLAEDGVRDEHGN